MRALLFDGEARQVQGIAAHRPYQVEPTADGGVEVDADDLARKAIECLTELHGELGDRKPAAVAFDGFWHSVLGIDDHGKPVTPIIHLFDTRSAGKARELATRIDPEANHKRTGCVLHASYWPAKLLWLQENRRDAFAAAVLWISFGEYLYLQLFGEPRSSTSMVSGSGLWNQNNNDYDEPMLAQLPIKRGQLTAQFDDPLTKLKPEYASLWPVFQGIPWFPALGDGACNNLGSGCVSPDRFALMVGTSGAMRAVIEAQQIDVPDGLWCYRVDRRRFVLGGALSNGGEVYAWMKRTLALPDEDELEAQLARMTPGSHGLTMLPFFAGERSPYWRADLRAALSGMSLATTPVDIVRASLESVALRFRQIYEILSTGIGVPREVIASGGALLHSAAWTQMMADSLARPVIACREEESSSRGAALLALERIGAIESIHQYPPSLGETFEPEPGHPQIYERLQREQHGLFHKLFEES